MIQVGEVIIPRLQEIVQMRFGDAKDLVALVAAKTLHESELHRVEPDFSGIVITRNMYVRGLKTIRHIKEESKPMLAEQGRHNGMLSKPCPYANLCCPRSHITHQKSTLGNHTSHRCASDIGFRMAEFGYGVATFVARLLEKGDNKVPPP
jgi:hypothetical protein